MKRIKANQPIKANKDLVYPKISYQITGVLFKVHNRLGSGYQEKVYQNAVEVELKRAEIPYEREKYVPVTYEKEKVGKYFVDFVIDDKIVLEIKQKDYFDKQFIPQVLDYLNGLRLKLGITQRSCDIPDYVCYNCQLW